MHLNATYLVRMPKIVGELHKFEITFSVNSKSK